jgi:hypothetical protein
MPDILRTGFIRHAIRPISVFQPDRFFARPLALPWWSSMNEVSGQASRSSCPDTCSRLGRPAPNRLGLVRCWSRLTLRRTGWHFSAPATVA